jgi:hypothetical protein
MRHGKPMLGWSLHMGKTSPKPTEARRHAGRWRAPEAPNRHTLCKLAVRDIWNRCDDQMAPIELTQTVYGSTTSRRVPRAASASLQQKSREDIFF